MKKEKDTCKFIKYPCGCYSAYFYTDTSKRCSDALNEHIKKFKKIKNKTKPYSIKVFLCDRHREFMKGYNEYCEGEN